MLPLLLGIIHPLFMRLGLGGQPQAIHWRGEQQHKHADR